MDRYDAGAEWCFERAARIMTISSSQTSPCRFHQLTAVPKALTISLFAPTRRRCHANDRVGAQVAACAPARPSRRLSPLQSFSYAGPTAEDLRTPAPTSLTRYPRRPGR